MEQNFKWGSVEFDAELYIRIQDTMVKRKAFDDALRSAFVVLEERLRLATGAPRNEVGVDLINRAFKPDKGILQVPEDPPAEKQGLCDLMKGIFLLYRNPVSHRSIYLTENEAWNVLYVINICLSLIQKQSDRIFNLESFLSPHEGQVLAKKLQRLDVDLDGEEELVFLLLIRELDRTDTFALPLIIDKGPRGWRRVSVEKISRCGCESPGHATLKYLTGKETPELVTFWEHASGSGVVVHGRSDDGTYRLLSKGDARGKNYQDCCFACTHWGFAIVDFDGDGKDEIVEVDYPEPNGEQKYTAWGWDNQAQKFQTVASVIKRPT